MLHHVSLEVPPDVAEPCADFWRLLGFEVVTAPEALGGYVTWLERKGTQIHLIHTPEPRIPLLGHCAVIVDDFEGTIERLDAAGHDVERARELWGEPRAFVASPAGHRVELMDVPPPAESSNG